MHNNKKNLGRVVLIHGVKFRRSDRRKIEELAPAFREAGFSVLMPTYGFVPALLMGLFSWLDNRLADTMASFLNEDDILLGHSNGATLVYLISKRKRIKGAILVNAALEVDLLPNAAFVHVYFNEGDIITRLSSFVPFNPWGSMGGKGYLGTSKHVRNIDQGQPPEELPKLHGHTALFKAGNARPWSRFMAKLTLQSVHGLNHRSSNHV